MEGFLGANSRFSITGSLVKTAMGEIAGVRCQAVSTDGAFIDREYAYDPDTGVIFRLGDDSGEKRRPPVPADIYFKSPVDGLSMSPPSP